MSTVRVPGPLGEPILVPTLGGATAAEADLPRDFAADFHRDGYTVLPGLIDPGTIERLRSAIDEELRPSRRFFWRQTTGLPERHADDPHDHLSPPLHQLQDLRESAFPRVRPTALDLLTDSRIQGALRRVMGEQPVLVQSMLFEANPATPAHQDTQYLDSTRRGELVAAWVALEDIAPEAGRFFVCPGSQRLELASTAEDFQGTLHHDRYLALIRERVRQGDLEVRAPALRAGDVLLWGSRTIHGSLPTLDPSRSRLSLTAHYIPASAGFLRMQALVAGLDVEKVNGMGVHRQRPQERWRWRATLQVAARFPWALAQARIWAARLRS